MKVTLVVLVYKLMITQIEIKYILLDIILSWLVN